jgi:hypothetical protein
VFSHVNVQGFYSSGDFSQDIRIIRLKAGFQTEKQNCLKILLT